MFLLASLLAEGFILSGIIIEAQVILDFQNDFFNFINLILLEFQRSGAFQGSQDG